MTQTTHELLPETARIFVAGHRGLVGSAVTRRLAADGHEVVTRDRDELDLRDAARTESFLRDVRPDAVVLAAAKVGGIMANSTYPVQFLEDNLRIQLSVIAGAHAAGAGRLLFLGSSCIYPKLAPQPIREDALLTGPLEPTNEPYALAKIAGITQIRAYRRQYGASYISAMPTNLYGPGDNFDLETSHVLPALIRRFHEAGESGAPEVTLWGTGTPRREFLHVDDLAAACAVLLRSYDGDDPVNVGCGEDLTIRELAETVREVTGYPGRIAFDATRPDGTPRKLLDISRISALGWKPRIPLRDGIAAVYAGWRAGAAA
ncbi:MULTISPECIES: GDP-L-fucose synthase family protein [Streptomyces]|uniref:GDP-L-fucose synthase n=2 Tax=Streptomyces TaxID=1883 RepID=A0A3R7IY09_9ACTN|nr:MULTISPECIES: GDP-L-fucose synthase [Streptomyces]KNE82345.1 GDP-fucose synthetase [Streptomyces fradiae]OFA55966.1 GDP-fucose synthetase [Streptomyces fradiae]PQM24991.1 GDP-L-fucose synthase [Streptomyces xinghaiensis]RKM99042.1 GDP-L-fucose synthase [Streptomyces xinghaiensis]RNC76054.1 GDP-L-fucose synthase [Streptomyces xinghaiensis]